MNSEIQRFQSRLHNRRILNFQPRLNSHVGIDRIDHDGVSCDDSWHVAPLF